MIKHSMHTYSTGREHRLVFTPDIPCGPADVVCRVYPPGERRATEFNLDPLDCSFEMYYKFRNLGDYIMVISVAGEVTNILKAVVAT